LQDGELADQLVGAAVLILPDFKPTDTTETMIGQGVHVTI
jgi:hypothetical protein